METTTDLQPGVVYVAKELLRASGAKQSDLARWLHRDPSTITERFKGVASITVRDLGLYAEFFDVPASVFFLGEDDLDAWLAKPGRRRALRQRVQVDLHDSLAVRSRCAVPYAQPALPGFDGQVWVGAAPVRSDGAEHPVQESVAA